jgi:hypothetical protein
MTQYGPISVYQDGMPVTELTAKPGLCADHTGWRGYYLENVTVALNVSRETAKDRFFADIKCVTRFPEFGHEFAHNAPCDMPAGRTNGTAKFDSYSIPLNFKEPHDTDMEVEFNMGAGALAKTTIPIKYPGTFDKSPAVRNA